MMFPLGDVSRKKLLFLELMSKRKAVEREYKETKLTQSAY